jgi:hypothetical protein
VLIRRNVNTGDTSHYLPLISLGAVYDGDPSR